MIECTSILLGGNCLSEYGSRYGSQLLIVKLQELGRESSGLELISITRTEFFVIFFLNVYVTFHIEKIKKNFIF